MDIIINMLRTVSFFLDEIVYSAIPIMYKIFLSLSQIDLLAGGDNPLRSLIDRVYVFLGIFMLFKVAFSMIQYLIDPNSFSDSSKGFGHLVTNILVAMILLVVVTPAFEFAMKLQGEIIRSNAIGELILGETINSDGQDLETGVGDDSSSNGTINMENIDVMATDLQFLVFGAFFHIDSDVIPECKGSEVFGSVAMAKDKSGNCLSTLKEAFISSDNDMLAAEVGLNDFFKYNTDEDGNQRTEYGKHRKFSHFRSLLWWKEGGEYAVSYMALVSTLAGVVIVIMLVSFSLDIAVRVFKLCLLQMIAPIAIVSYADPKESMADSRLRRWITECISTYLSLFIRQAIIFLAIVLISAIANTVLASDSEVQQQLNNSDISFWIYLFLILGIFLFVKEVPKILDRIFKMNGISGDLTINPFKKSEGLSKITGAAVGLAASAPVAFKALKEGNPAFQSIAAATVSGIKNGWRSGMKNGMYGNTKSEVYKDITGNEYVRYNLATSIMGLGGKRRERKLGADADEAQRQLNELDDQMTSNRYNMDLHGKALSNAGVNLNNLADERARREASILAGQGAIAQAEADVNLARSKRNAAAAALAQAENDLERAKSDSNPFVAKLREAEDELQKAVAYNTSPIAHAGPNIDEKPLRDAVAAAKKNVDLQEKALTNSVTAAKRELETHEGALETANVNLGTIRTNIQNDTSIINHIDSYEQSVNVHRDIVNRTTKLQKDKSLVENQRSQERARSHLDESPTKKVKAARERIASGSAINSVNTTISSGTPHASGPNNMSPGGPSSGNHYNSNSE